MTDQLISGAGYHLCRTYTNDCPGYLGVNLAESYPAEDGGVMEARTCNQCDMTYFFHRPDGDATEAPARFWRWPTNAPKDEVARDDAFVGKLFQALQS